MSKTRIRMMEPILVIGSMLLLVGAITALWRFSEAGKPSSASNDFQDASASSFQGTAQAVLVTKAAVSLPQLTTTNFDNYKSQDPAKAIVGTNGQAVARLKTLPTGFTDVSILIPDVAPASQTQTGLTTIGSVRYMGTNGQIIIETVKPAVGQSFNQGSQQLTLQSGEKAWYDTNLTGQFSTRLVLQRDNLLILINSNLQTDQLKNILEDVTLN